VSAKFAFIDAEKAQYSIVKMCAWIGVSTSGYYEWRDRPPSATARRRTRLAALIEPIFTDSDQTYGHRRIHAALARQGERVTWSRANRGPGDPGPPSPATPARSRTSSPATSLPTSRAPSSSGISLTCRPGRAGCTWQR